MDQKAWHAQGETSCVGFQVETRIRVFLVQCVSNLVVILKWELHVEEINGLAKLRVPKLYSK